MYRRGDNTPYVIARGSAVRRYAVGIIAPGATTSPINVVDQFPELRTWEPFDSLVVQNNSAVNIEVYLNGDTNDVYFIPAYMIQPIMRRWYRFITIKNTSGAVATVAGDIQVEFRRLPPDITPTVQVQ